jgi:spore cortex biosynthesis protein YabQ
MVGAGVHLGVAYDTYSRLRVKKKNQWLTMLQDVLFWFLNVTFIFAWLHAVNNGEMRVYVLLSLLCGYAMYKALFQQIYRSILQKVISIMIYMYNLTLKIIYNLIIKPIIWIYELFVAVILFSVAVIVKVGQFLLSLLLFIFRPFFRIYLLTKGKIKGLWKEYVEKRSAKKEKQKRGFLQVMAKWLFKKKRK